MKILVITNIPTPYRNAFYNVLGRCLAGKECRLKVLFCAKSEPNRHWKIDPQTMQFEHEFLPGIHLNLRKIFVHFNPGIIRKTNEFDPDVVLYSGAWNMLTVMYSLLHTRMFNKSWKTLFWSEGHEGSILYPKGIIPIIRLWILNKFDGFAVPNQRSRNYLFNYLNVRHKPVIMLPNTVNGQFFTKPQSWNENDRTRVLKQLGLLPEKRICIQISQIESRKGIMELVEYWHALPSDLKEDFVLVLVGEGSLKNEVQNYCKTNGIGDVVLTGNKSADEVRDLLFTSDLFVLLTKNDPNPLTLIEASFAGLPVLTTIFAGNHDEIVFPDINGRVLDEISYKQFLKAFTKVKELSSMSAARNFSFENASTNFDISQVAERFTSQVRLFLNGPDYSSI
jgi:glycosyltransferase involved in cell wall biosynthesis